ncbi:hypothetical protein SY88_07680 [Clostridiales bacterium PH28_bin88]|nr:hypothetical protein SY88_07680 [Clostridiales bacterium PH28_bin88]
MAPVAREQALAVLRRGLAAAGIALNPVQEEQFWRYYQELLEWNNRFNLTAITGEEQVMLKHFTDSLLCSAKVDFQPGMRICDVGSGAGFPGVPLKIWLPGLHLCMLDATKKRVEFLRHLVEIIGLTGAEAVHGRAEEWGREPGWREGFDRVLSRAVGPMAVLAEYCLPLVRTGGMMIALKGPEVDLEVEGENGVFHMLGGELEGVYRHRLPISGDSRRTVVIRKVTSTPEKYPRKPGLPEKRPLGKN